MHVADGHCQLCVCPEAVWGRVGRNAVGQFCAPAAVLYLPVAAISGLAVATCNMHSLMLFVVLSNIWFW